MIKVIGHPVQGNSKNIFNFFSLYRGSKKNTYLKVLSEITLLFFFFISTITYGGNGKIPLTQKDTVEKKMNLPIIELSAGPMNFYGDIKKNNYYKLFHFKFGYEIGATKQLSNNISVSAHILYGKVSGEERSPSRSLNFVSPIFSPYISGEYSLNRFKKFKIGYVSPYVTVGIGLVYFHPKGDLLDANGNAYYYWSDGTIKNLPETEQNKPIATSVYRDYVYETDLRKANIDDFGNYSLITMAIPIGIGLNCKVTPKITVKLGTTLHYTFTDLMDNVNVRSIGNRQGKAGMDKYLFSSVTLCYNLNPVPPDPDEFMFNGVDLLSISTDDSDGDGVIDFEDDCPDTPPGIEVDTKGCPFDDDYDGVPNYRDKEKDTPLGAVVDADGVKIKDEDIEKAYVDYLDSVPKGNIPKEMYTVQLGIFKDGEVPKELLDKFLKIDDLEKFMLEDSSVVYFAGRYYTPEGAFQGLDELLKDSIPGIKVVKIVNGKFISVDKPSTKISPKDSLNEKNNATKDKIKEKDKEKKTDQTKNNIVDSLAKKTQLDSLAQKTKEIKTDSLLNPNKEKIVDKNKVKENKSDTLAKTDKEITKDVVNNKTDSLKNKESKNSIDKNLDKKLANANDKIKDQNLKTETNTAVDSLKEQNYSIQLAEYKTAVPQEDVKKIMTVNGVKSKKTDKGETSYTVGNYKTKTEAQAALDKFKKQGFPDAKIMGDNKQNEAVAKNTDAGSKTTEKNNQAEQINIIHKDTSKTKIVKTENTNENNVLSDRTGSFAVLLGKYTKDVPQNIIDKFLSVPDIMSTKIGDITYYTTKTVSTLSDAQMRLNELKNAGFSDAQIVEFKNKAIVPYKGDDAIASSQKEKTETKTPENKNVDVKSNTKQKNAEGINNEIEKKADPFIGTKEINTSDKNVDPTKKSDKGTATDHTEAVNTNNNTAITKNAIENTSSNISMDGLVFRVQLGAFVSKSTNDPYVEKGITDVISFPADGYTKYFTGAFDNYESAREHKIQMQQKGFSDAFVSAYKDGKRVEMKDALHYSPSTVKMVALPDNSNAIKVKPTGIIYKVQIGAFKNKVPAELLADMQTMSSEPADNGYTRLLSGNYSSYDDAKKCEVKLKEKGYSQAFIVAYKNGKRISLQEAEKP